MHNIDYRLSSTCSNIHNCMSISAGTHWKPTSSSRPWLSAVGIPVLRPLLPVRLLEAFHCLQHVLSAAGHIDRSQFITLECCSNALESRMRQGSGYSVNMATRGGPA